MSKYHAFARYISDSLFESAADRPNRHHVGPVVHFVAAVGLMADSQTMYACVRV
jgi:hypothetical protein